MRTASALLLALLAGCGSSGYVRVTAQDGRTFHARKSATEAFDAYGRVTFTDVVTKKRVTLQKGSFLVRSVSRSEIGAQRGDNFLWQDR